MKVTPLNYSNDIYEHLSTHHLCLQGFPESLIDEEKRYSEFSGLQIGLDLSEYPRIHFIHEQGGVIAAYDAREKLFTSEVHFYVGNRAKEDDATWIEFAKKRLQEEGTFRIWEQRGFTVSEEARIDRMGEEFEDHEMNVVFNISCSVRSSQELLQALENCLEVFRMEWS